MHSKFGHPKGVEKASWRTASQKDRVFSSVGSAFTTKSAATSGQTIDDNYGYADISNETPQELDNIERQYRQGTATTNPTSALQPDSWCTGNESGKLRYKSLCERTEHSQSRPFFNCHDPLYGFNSDNDSEAEVKDENGTDDNLRVEPGPGRRQGAELGTFLCFTMSNPFIFFATLFWFICPTGSTSFVATWLSHSSLQRIFTSNRDVLYCHFSLIAGRFTRCRGLDNLNGRKCNDTNPLLVL